jgi:hypothetical protein
MILSTLTDRTIALPMDGAEFERQLKRLIAESKVEKKVTTTASTDDFSKSHTR